MWDFLTLRLGFLVVVLSCIILLGPLPSKNHYKMWLRLLVFLY